MNVDENKSLVYFVDRICREYTPWRIIKALANSNGMTLRQLARRVDLAPKTLYVYLSKLENEGIIVSNYLNSRVRMIDLAPKYQWVKKHFK